MHFSLGQEDEYNHSELTQGEKMQHIYFTLIKFMNHFGLNQSKNLKNLFNNIKNNENKLKIWKMIFTITFLEDFYFLLKYNSQEKTFNNEISFINNQNDEISFINYNHNIPKKLTILSIMKSIILFKISNSIINEILEDTELGYNELENLIHSNFNETLNESKLEVIYNIDRNPNDLSHHNNENCLSNNVSIINETGDINHHNNLLVTDRSQKSNFFYELTEKKDFLQRKGKSRCEKCEINITKLNENERKFESMNYQIMNLRNYNTKLEEENKNYKNYIEILHNDKIIIENKLKEADKKINQAKNSEKIINDLSQENICLNQKFREVNEKIAELNEKIASNDDLENLLKDYKLQIKQLQNENKKLKNEKVRSSLGGHEFSPKSVETFFILGKKNSFIDAAADVNDNKNSYELYYKPNISKLQDVLKAKNEILDIRLKEIDEINRKIEDMKITLELKENKMKMLESTVSSLTKKLKLKEQEIKSMDITIHEKNQQLDKNKNDFNFFIIWSILLASVIFLSLYFSIKYTNFI